MKTAVLKSFDTYIIIATLSSSITLSVIGIGLIAIPISAEHHVDYQLVIYEIVMQKYNKYKRMRKVNKQLNLSIKSTANVYKIN